MLEPLASNRLYDLILCNPPYVNDHSMQALPPEFNYEPALALAGGADGMRLVGELLKQCANKLQKNGLLILEIGHERAHFEAAFPHLSPIWVDTMATTDQIMVLNAEQLQS